LSVSSKSGHRFCGSETRPRKGLSDRSPVTIIAMSELDDFKATYFDECSELLNELEEQFAAIEAGERHADRLNAVFRAIHSIKGGAGAFGFAGLVEFAHAYETLLDYVRDGRVEMSDDTVALCIRANDIVADHVAAAKSGDTLAADYGAAEKLRFDALSRGDADDGEGGEPVEDFDIDFTPVRVDLGLDTPRGRRFCRTPDGARCRPLGNPLHPASRALCARQRSAAAAARAVEPRRRQRARRPRRNPAARRFRPLRRLLQLGDRPRGARHHRSADPRGLRIRRGRLRHRHRRPLRSSRAAGNDRACRCRVRRSRHLAGNRQLRGRARPQPRRTARRRPARPAPGARCRGSEARRAPAACRAGPGRRGRASRRRAVDPRRPRQGRPRRQHGRRAGHHPVHADPADGRDPARPLCRAGARARSAGPDHAGPAGFGHGHPRPAGQVGVLAHAAPRARAGDQDRQEDTPRDHRREHRDRQDDHRAAFRSAHPHDPQLVRPRHREPRDPPRAPANPRPAPSACRPSRPAATS
jgi:HPt (histidine-containing phosphotransfer) domain-containing protein